MIGELGDPDSLYNDSLSNMFNALYNEHDISRYIERIERFDHGAGRFSGGLRTLEALSSRYIKAKHGNLCPRVVCMKRDANTSFPHVACAAARRAIRPCGHRHPGLCLSTHKETLADSLRLAKNIYDKIKGLKQRPGECIVEFAPAGRREDAKL